MCYSPITIKVESMYQGSKYIQVPCGHCLECLKQKQNALVARMCEEFKFYNYKAVFCTLTYREDTIPKNYFYKGKIYRSKSHYSYTNEDEWTGKKGGRLVLPSDPFQCLIDENIPVDCIVPFSWKDKNREVSAEVEDALANDIPVSFDSVRREDVKFAIDWFRKTAGRKVRVFLVSEYGSHTERPHYHAIFFGEDMDTLRPFLKFWKKHFGIYDASMCEGIGSLKYVGKYSSKGSFGNYLCCKDYFYHHEDGTCTEYHSKDFEYSVKFFGVNEPMCDQCFRVCPRGFGECYLTPEKIDYHIGRHDIKRMIKNRKYTFENGQQISLPKYYCEKIYNKYVKAKISREIQKSTDYSFEREYEVVEAQNPYWTDYEISRAVFALQAEREDYKGRQSVAFNSLNDKYKKDCF